MEFCLVRVFQPPLCSFGRHLVVFGSMGVFNLGGLATWGLVLMSSEVFHRERGFRRNPGQFLVYLLRLGK